MSELAEVKDDIRDLRKEVTRNTDITQQGFSKVDTRVSALELDKARREGKESVFKPSSGADWKKVTLALLSIMATSVSIAYIIVQAVFNK